MVQRDLRSSFYIMNVVSATSVIGCLWNCSILCISTVEGTWILGDVFCQVFAMFSYAMVTTVLWLTALAAFERFYKILSPVEHPATFSEINTRLLVVGVIFIAIVLCTAPLYGWGEYSHYKGTMNLHVNLSVQEINLGTLQKETNITSPVGTYIMGYNLAKLLCTGYSNDVHERTIDLFARVGSNYVSGVYDTAVRKSLGNCQGAMLSFILRANNLEAVDELHRAHESGSLGNTIAASITEHYSNVTRREILITANTSMDLTSLIIYKNIYIPFQDLGVCTFDFTAVNTHMLSSILYILMTTTIAPYFVILVCGCGIFFKHNNGCYHCADDITHLKIVYICGFSSILFCIPYYVTNFLNARGQMISVGANFFSTMLFYMMPMCISGPYLYHRLSYIKLKERLFFTKKEFLNRKNDETQASAVSLKLDNL